MKQIRTAKAETAYFGWCNQHSALLWIFISNTATCSLTVSCDAIIFPLWYGL